MTTYNKTTEEVWENSFARVVKSTVWQGGTCYSVSTKDVWLSQEEMRTLANLLNEILDDEAEEQDG